MTTSITTAQIAPAIDSGKITKNILASLGCERATLPLITIGKRVYALELIGVYCAPKNTDQDLNKSPLPSNPNRKISHYTISRIDNGQVLATLTPDQNIGLLIKKKSESVSTELLKQALEKILSPEWLIEKIAQGELKAGILGIALVFSLVTFASGSDYMGQAIPITADQSNGVKTEFNRCMQAIQDLIALPGSGEVAQLPETKIKSKKAA